MKHEYSYKAGDISLRPLSGEDSERYRQLRNREDNRKWFKTDSHITTAMQEKWYEEYLQKDTEYMFSIVENVSSAFIGAVALYDVDQKRGSAEIGRIIVDRYRFGGKGYAACALDAVCRMAKDMLGLRQVYAEIYADNEPSIRSFYKAGFLKTSCTEDEKGRPMILVSAFIDSPPWNHV